MMIKVRRSQDNADVLIRTRDIICVEPASKGFGSVLHLLIPSNNDIKMEVCQSIDDMHKLILEQEAPRG